jgi:hypothetical protein
MLADRMVHQLHVTNVEADEAALRLIALEQQT